MKEELCPECGLILVEGYRCECGYLSKSAEEQIVKMWRQRRNDPYPNFYEVCHYQKFWFIFRFWDALFDGSIPLNKWHSYIKED